MPSISDIAESFFRSYEKGDVDAALGLFAADARIQECQLSVADGTESIRTWLRQFRANTISRTFQRRFIDDKDAVAVEWNARVRFRRGASIGHTLTVKQHFEAHFSGVTVFRFAPRTRLIKEMNVYYDRGDLHAAASAYS